MDLSIFWFVLIAVLYTGYFVLEGFDFGVGILLPILGRKDEERRILINTIGPHWDGNEVWLITAGGATFAAFPSWYATLFSGYYLPLLLILVALIFRGVAFEFRSQVENPRWRAAWDWAIFGGSLLPALLWGVAFASFLQGVPIGADQQFVGGFFDIVTPYSLLGGLTALLGFMTHGAVFLTLRTEGNLLAAARKLAYRLWLPAVALLLLFTVFTYFSTDILQHLGINPGPIPIGAVAALLLAGYFIRKRRDGWAFSMTSLTILLAVTTIFLSLFPRVLVSTIDPTYSLTIYNSASGPVTLRTMSTIALIFTPIVLAYQAWTYWLFRRRIIGKAGSLHY